jgi:glycogen debranching enzyme
MDKMGESERAGSKGVPGTPRDGAAIEITGLAYSTLVWVAELHEQGSYRYKGVKISEGKRLRFINGLRRSRGTLSGVTMYPQTLRRTTITT